LTSAAIIGRLSKKELGGPAAAKENAEFFLTEGIKSPIGAQGLPHHLCRRRRPSLDGGHEAIDLTRRIRHLRDTREVDPSEDLQKLKGRSISAFGRITGTIRNEGSQAWRMMARSRRSAVCCRVPAVRSA
jgi:hypothetical protein